VRTVIIGEHKAKVNSNLQFLRLYWEPPSCILVFTKSVATVRVISLRRAHKTEVKRYEEKA